MDAESAAGGRPGSGLLPGCSRSHHGDRGRNERNAPGSQPRYQPPVPAFHQRGLNPLSVPSPGIKPFVIPSHCGSQPRSRSPLCRARVAGRVAEMPARPSAHPPRPGWRRVPRRERKWPSRILSLIEREAGAHPNPDMKILSGPSKVKVTLLLKTKQRNKRTKKNPTHLNPC